MSSEPPFSRANVPPVDTAGGSGYENENVAKQDMTIFVHQESETFRALSLGFIENGEMGKLYMRKFSIMTFERQSVPVNQRQHKFEINWLAFNYQVCRENVLKTSIALFVRFSNSTQSRMLLKNYNKSDLLAYRTDIITARN